MKKTIALFLGAALLCAGVAQAAEKPQLRIGARVFTEQTVLAEITAQYLRANGFDVRVTTGLGSNIARQAQETGQLDLMWEYTGVSLVSYNHIDERMPDAAATYARVKELDAKKGLVWLTPSKFSNTYALGLPKAVAEAYPQINSISDLNQVLRDEPDRNHLVALDTEFANRPDGLVGLRELYELPLDRRNIRQMDGGLVYTAMRNNPVVAGPLQASATVLLTIPSIALFGLLLPFYSKFGQGLGPLPAITAVFLYSLLPILRNTYLALTNVEPGIREAARGIGMTFGQRLRMVELPIAVPVILAGVRTAVVMNIGVMTIAATIGAGGLGVLILTSISRSDMSMLLVGAVLVSLLAIIADLLLQALQRALTPEGLRS